MKTSFTGLLNIEAGEEKLVLLSFLQAVFFGFPKLFSLMTANSLFLEHYEADNLPYIYLFSSLFVPVTGFIRLYFEKHISFIRLQSGTLAALILVSSIFCIILWFTEIKWISIALYIWLAVELVMAEIVLWSTANRLFTVRQSKRLFGLIGAGGILAFILGGFLTPYIISTIGTRGLLLLSLIGFLLALVNFIYMSRQFRNKLIVNKRRQGLMADSEPKALSIKAMFKNRYLVLIFAFFAVFSQVIYYLGDNIFYLEMHARYPNADELASFIGRFWAVYGVLSLIFRSLAAGRWTLKVGLLGGMLTSQIVVGFFALLALIISLFNFSSEIALIFWLIALMKLFDKILTGSITNPAYHTLYQPLIPEQRVRVQTVTESIVGPIGGMLTSLLLLLLTKFFDFSSLQLAIVLLVVILICIAIAFLTVEEYRKALASALNRRGLEGTDLSLDDASSLEILEKGLESHHAKEILYCLKLLEEVNHPKLKEHLLELTHHQNAEVRAGVYSVIERLAPEDSFELLRQRLAIEHTAQLRIALFRALAATDEIEAFDLIQPYLRSKDKELQQGAIVSLIRYCGIEGAVSAGSYLMNLQNSTDPENRQMAAKILGDIGVSNFYRGLLPLLEDDNMEVRQSALYAAGQLDNRKLWTLVIQNLAFLQTREAAVKALRQSGKSAFPVMEIAYYGEKQSAKVRREIIHLYGRIKGKEATRLLLQKLEEPDRNLRYEIFWSLYLCGYQSIDEEGKNKIETLLIDEVSYGMKVLTLQQGGLNKHEELLLLSSALEYELEKAQGRIFLLLSMVYPAEVIMRIWSNFREASVEKQDLALELFDNTVQSGHKAIVLPILEMGHQQSDMISPSNAHDWIVEMMSTPEIWNNTWIRACNIATVSQIAPIEAFREHIIPLMEDDDPLIRETAQHVLDNDNKTDSFSTIEKVKILKNVSIFSEIPDEILAEAVPFLEGIRLEAGEQVFEKGEIGTSLYIIVDGLLRVYDEDETLAELGKGNIFGEFSALDPEPRTASVETLQPSYLFKLSQAELRTLIESHLEVARGIIQILCHRLRTSLARGQESHHKKEPKKAASSYPKVLPHPVHTHQLSLIEKVIILKTVSIFSDTPDNILSDIANMTQENFLKRGQTLFKKGEVGTSMYIVVDGRIKVHDEDQVIAELGERALIGEMAVLSSEPRTASVTAVQDTLLLSLTQNALFELMWDQHKIVEGIIKILIQRLRSLR